MTRLLQNHDGLSRRALALLVLLFCLAGQAGGEEVNEAEVKVDIQRGEETIVRVDAVIHAPVSVQEAYAVLSDFDRFAEFVPNVTSSRIVSKPGETIRIEQKGKARYALFTFSYESTREFELIPPDTIKSRVIKGNMKRMETVTRITAEGNGARIHYHNEAVPSFWVPPLLGAAFIRHETAEQFGAIVREMLKRRGGN